MKYIDQMEQEAREIVLLHTSVKHLWQIQLPVHAFLQCSKSGILLKGFDYFAPHLIRIDTWLVYHVVRNASGQGHSTVNFPVRNAGGRSARLLIYTVTPI